MVVRALLAAFLLVITTFADSFALDPIGEEFRVNTYTSCNQDTSAVAALPGGGFVVVWESGSTAYQQDGALTGVFGQRFDAAGDPAGTEFLVNVYTSGNQKDPAVAADAGGAFVVVWTSAAEQDGSEEGIFARRFASDGAPGSEVQVNTYTQRAQLAPDVVAAAGGFVVVWDSRQDGSDEGVFGRLLDDGGAPVGSELALNTYTEGRQALPRVAALDDGAFVVAWQSGPGDDLIAQDGSGTGVFAQRFDSAGTPAGTEFRVNAYTTGEQLAPDVAAASDGGFVVTWEGQGAEGAAEVASRRFDSGGEAIGDDTLVNAYTTGTESNVAIARAGDGFFVVWDTDAGTFAGTDAEGLAVVARALDASAQVAGADFRVNSYAPGDQSVPAVAGLAGGDFVASWESTDQDGQQHGIFAQRFAGDDVAGPDECGDGTGDGEITASDALMALATAVGSQACATCACDVNDSGGITASDALAILNVAVGQNVALGCPAC